MKVRNFEFKVRHRNTALQTRVTDIEVETLGPLAPMDVRSRIFYCLNLTPKSLFSIVLGISQALELIEEETSQLMFELASQCEQPIIGSCAQCGKPASFKRSIRENGKNVEHPFCSDVHAHEYQMGCEG